MSVNRPRAVAIIFILISLAIFPSLNMAGIPSACAESPMYGYDYVRLHYVVGSQDGPLTDYPVRFVIHSGRGLDSGENIYLDGKSLSWPYDIRFTDDKNLPFSYWIETYDGNTAIIWVKIRHIPVYNNAAIVNIHYGREGDIKVSDGDATFILFDDFEKSDVYRSNWNVEGDVHIAWTAEEGSLRMTPNSGITARNVDVDSCAVMAVMKLSSASGTEAPRFSIKVRNSDYLMNNYEFRFDNDLSQNYASVNVIKNPEGGELQSFGAIWAQGISHRIETRSCREYSQFLVDEYTNFKVTHSSDASGTAGIYARGDCNPILISWIAVRPYTMNEPTHGYTCAPVESADPPSLLELLPLGICCFSGAVIFALVIAFAIGIILTMEWGKLR